MIILKYFVVEPLVVKRDIAVTVLLRFICVHPSLFVLAITPNIYTWISKLFDTVAVLEEEKCHLKHF